MAAKTAWNQAGRLIGPTFSVEEIKVGKATTQIPYSRLQTEYMEYICHPINPDNIHGSFASAWSMAQYLAQFFRQSGDGNCYDQVLRLA